MNRIVKFLGSKEDLCGTDGLVQKKKTKWSHFKSYLKLKDRSSQQSPVNINKERSVSSPNLYFVGSNSQPSSNFEQIYEEQSNLTMIPVPVANHDSNIEDKENFLFSGQKSKRNIVMGITASRRARQALANGSGKPKQDSTLQLERPTAKPRESLVKRENNGDPVLKSGKGKKPIPLPRTISKGVKGSDPLKNSGDNPDNNDRSDHVPPTHLSF